jgi:hypothetical protein
METGIDWNRMRPEAKALLGKVGTQWLLFFIYLSLTLAVVSVGLRCQTIIVARIGLEELSVSVGSEIRKLGKGGRKYAVGSEVGPPSSWTVPSI